jgi:competence protein ComGC
MIKNKELIFRAKKAFTLIEVTISITLFMIVVLFLYKTLDQTKYSNKQFEDKQEKLIFVKNLNKIFLEDFAESYGTTSLSIDTEKKSMVKFTSYNTYHNSFHNHITYMIGSNDTLVRIESLDAFKGIDSTLDFYENANIDILLKDIELFEVKNSGSEYVIVLKQKNKPKEIFKAFKLGE